MKALINFERIANTRSGDTGGKVTYSFTMPVSAWLPSKGVQPVAGPVRWKFATADFCIEIYSLPYSAAGYGSKDRLAGIEIRLAATESVLMELELPIRLEVLSSSKLSAPRAHRDMYGNNSPYVVNLDTDTIGELRGASGVRLLLKRRSLASLHILDSIDHGQFEERDLKDLRGCVAADMTVTWELSMQRCG